jgi:putative ABC transport system substrate-binding protein
MESFRLALRQFGYIEGQTVGIELRYAEKGVRQLPELAAELVRLEVDVITTFGDLAPKVAQQATGTIPIVAICDDIIGAGLVASLAHPTAKITGLTILSPELSAKRLELLKELVPGLSRVAALWDPTTGKAQFH